MKTVIIGGGAAGASCAARLRRLDEAMEITILEKTEEVSIATCGLPYYFSNIIGHRDKVIITTKDTFEKMMNVSVKLNAEVTSINCKEKYVMVNHEEKYEFDKLVFTPGGTPVIPDIEGINNQNVFKIKNLRDVDMMKEYMNLKKVKKAVVVGGGFVGVEMAENLTHLKVKTTLVEASHHILPNIDSDIASLAQNHMREKGVDLVLEDGVVRFEENFLVLESGEKIDFDIAVWAVGMKPDTKIAKECGLSLGMKDGIKVNEYMQTSNKDIFAAGDAVIIQEVILGEDAIIPLASPASRQGRIVADNICGKKTKYKGSIGAGIIKIFDMTVAFTGLNEQKLLEKGISYNKNHTWSNSHASYYPGAYPILIKLVFSEKGKVYGAQAAGFDGVDKRIDVISAVLMMDGDLQDLIDCELCYAPPYSSVKDPVNIAAMAASNVNIDKVELAFPEDVSHDKFLVDIRPPLAYKYHTIEGAVNIPAAEIRKSLDMIPKDKEVILFCNKGFTSYNAYKILRQDGYEKISSLSGGISLYDEVKDDKDARK